MPHKEEERTRLRRLSSKQAISLAMQGRWREAAAANKALLESFPDDIDACNRLGRACVELGEYAPGKEAYERALEIDPYNTIAKKNLERLSHLGEGAVTSGTAFRRADPQHFIEEVGKAGIVKLRHLAPARVLARMAAGDMVKLRLSGLDLVVENSRGEYLGQVEPRYSLRLVRLMKGGNRYKAAVVSSAAEVVKVLIKEVYQTPSQVGVSPFPPKGAGVSPWYVSDRIIRREIESAEALSGETSYTIVGGDADGEELIIDESSDDDDTEDEE